MNKAQFVEILSKKTKLPKTQTETLLDAAVELIQKQVASGHEIKIVGFGTFTSTKRKPRVGRNPKTGQTVQIPSLRVPKFKPGKEFKQKLN